MTEKRLLSKEQFDVEPGDTDTLNISNRSRQNTLRMKTSLEDLQSLMFWKALFAEFIGTFILVLLGVGSTVQGWEPDTPDIVQIAFSFGLAVATSVWIIGHVSGGHINPAITMAMFITRKISLIKAVLYMIAQCIGSTAAAIIVKVVTPASQRGPLGCTTLAEGMTTGKGVAIELFITFVLVLTVFATCDKNRKDHGGSFPLTIGLAVTLGHLWAVEYTGSSMNPARTLGPAIVMEAWRDHWIYWVGPLSGGIIGGVLYDNLLASNASLIKARNCMLASDFDDERYKARKTKVVLLEEDDDENKFELNDTPSDSNNV